MVKALLREVLRSTFNMDASGRKTFILIAFNEKGGCELMPG